MNRYVGLNCSKCGRFVGKDGFADCGYNAEGTPEIGYPLCKRCLDARGPTIYDLECDIRDWKKQIAMAERQIENMRQRFKGIAAKHSVEFEILLDHIDDISEKCKEEFP